MMGLGVIVGVAISGGIELHSLEIFLLYPFVTGFSLTGAAMAINDYFDRFIDSVNEPDRPIPSGKVEPVEAVILTIFLSIIGLSAAWLTCFICFIIAVFAWFTMIIYSAWGKRKGFIGNLMVSSCITLPFIYGGVAAGNLQAGLLFSIIAFLSGTGREVTKGIADVEGDSDAGVKTVAVSYGVVFASRVATAFIISSVFISIIPYILSLVSIWYLPFIVLTDIIFVYGSANLIRKPSRENSREVKNMILYGMLSGLIGFAAGSLM
jgi:geranylgeranylglycerol-phosphate geranylgeranyltransferase